MNVVPADKCAQWLAEALAAQHSLRTSQQVVELWHGDQRTRYSPANSSELAQYIAQLQAQCGNCSKVKGRSIGMIF